MGVYVVKKNSPWYQGPLELLASSLIGGMMQRNSAAQDYKMKTRLAEEDAARKNDASALARQQALEDRQSLINYWNEDPNRAAGGGGILGLLPSLGYTGNAEQVGKWALPQTLTVDQGDKRTVVPMYSNGTIGDGQSYDVGMSPTDQGNLNLATENLALQKWKALQDANYKARALSISAGNANRPNLDLMGGVTDTNGNPAMIDKKSGRVVSLPGLKVSSAGPDYKGAYYTAKILQLLNGGGNANNANNEYDQMKAEIEAAAGKGTSPSSQAQGSDYNSLLVPGILQLLGIPGNAQPGGGQPGVPGAGAGQGDGWGTITPSPGGGTPQPSGTPMFTMSDIQQIQKKTGKKQSQVINDIVAKYGKGAISRVVPGA